MKIGLIVNPVASSVTKRTRLVIQKAFAADHELEVVETSAKGDGTKLAAKFAEGGAELVLGLGGDGTINEIVNGTLGSDCAIAPLPGGSTNVFARSLGYPNEAVEATAVMLDALNEKSIKPASVGIANGRAFLFHVGAGFDAAVVENVEKKGPLKRYLGHPLFVASTITTWLRKVDRSNPWFSIETDSNDVIEGAQLGVALNCNPYTYLGRRPIDLAPEATLETDLSLIALTKVSATKLGPALFTALRSDQGIPNSKATVHLQGIKKATFIGYKPFPYQLDGEFLDPVAELELESRRDAIRVVVPTQN